MKFVKVHCGANDFIILDLRKSIPPKDLKKTIRAISARRTGIGADGVIIIENSKKADFKLRYFNPDGGEYAVCGDGSLCAVLYKCRGVAQNNKEMSFSTLAGVLKGNITNNKVRVEIPIPRDIKLYNLNIQAVPLPHFRQIKTNISTSPNNKKEIECNFVDIWVPHCIIFVEDINSIDMTKDATPIRFHPDFGNEGTNVNFMQIINKHRVAVRTYERGVEDETLSCGSGSCASCVVGWLDGKLQSPIEVKTKIEKLVVALNNQSSASNAQRSIDNLEAIWLEGNPKIVYEGDI